MSDKTEQFEQSITANIIDLIEAGNLLPWRRPWVLRRGDQSLPWNLSTGTPYSGSNIIALWLANMLSDYESQAWLTFRQAKALGGSVRKGEKGTACCFYKRRVIDDERSSDGSRVLFSPHPFTVFNIAQIDGIELPEPEVVEPPVNEDGEPLATEVYDSSVLRTVAQQAIDNTGLQVYWGGAKACYIPKSDIVWMPDGFEQNYTGLASALSHELVHATGSPKRLDRFSRIDTRFKKKDRPSYAFEELVAELGAVFLCTQLGVPVEIEQNAAYLQSWLKGLKSDVKFLSQAASEASKAARYLADGCTVKAPAATPAAATAATSTRAAA